MPSAKKHSELLQPGRGAVLVHRSQLASRATSSRFGSSTRSWSHRFSRRCFPAATTGTAAWLRTERRYRPLGSDDWTTPAARLSDAARVVFASACAYPGGAEVEKLSREGRESIAFPVPATRRVRLQAFSGLKTAVLYHRRDHPDAPRRCRRVAPARRRSRSGQLTAPSRAGGKTWGSVVGVWRRRRRQRLSPLCRPAELARCATSSSGALSHGRHSAPTTRR